MVICERSDSAMDAQELERFRRAVNSRWVGRFSSYLEAARHGYYSLNRLKEMGLEVRELEYQNYLYVVESHGRDLSVYSIQQCDNILQGRQGLDASAKSLGGNGVTDQETDVSSTPTQHSPAVPPPPFDVQNALKSGAAKEIPQKPPLDRSKGSEASCTAYFPEDFEAHDWAVIKGMEEEAALVFDQFYKFRHVHGQGADEYVSFSWAYGRELVGQRKFDRMMNVLLEVNVLERTEVKEDPFGLGVWIPRGKGTGLAYGYRFTNPEYRRNYSKVIIKSKGIERRLKRLRNNVRYPVQKHLRRLLLEELTTIVPEDAELLAIAEGDLRKADAVKEQLRAVQEGERFFEVDRKTRRIYSNLTSLKCGARRFLRVRGEPLRQVDLPCCHLLGLAHKCVEAGSAGRGGVSALLRTGLLPAARRRGRFHPKASQGGVHPTRPQRPEPPPLPAIQGDEVLPQPLEAHSPVHVAAEGERQAHQGLPQAAQQARPRPPGLGGEPRHLPNLRPHQAGMPGDVDCHHPRRGRVP